MKRKLIYLVTILWIAFIWCNSFINGPTSSDISGGVLDFINFVLSFIGIKYEFSGFIIRKLAHFTEYFVLGLLLCFDLKNMKIKLYNSLFIGLVIALIDESIQLFSVGRASSVIDVWIDFSGVIISFLVIKILHKIKKE